MCCKWNIFYLGKAFVSAFNRVRIIYIFWDLFRFTKPNSLRKVQKFWIISGLMGWNRLIILLVFQIKSIENTILSFLLRWSCMSLIVRCYSTSHSQVFFILVGAENFQGVSFVSLLVLGWKWSSNWWKTFV